MSDLDEIHSGQHSPASEETASPPVSPELLSEHSNQASVHDGEKTPTQEEFDHPPKKRRVDIKGVCLDVKFLKNFFYFKCFVYVAYRVPEDQLHKLRVISNLARHIGYTVQYLNCNLPTLDRDDVAGIIRGELFPQLQQLDEQTDEVTHSVSEDLHCILTKL